MKNGPYELVLAPSDYPGFRYRGRYCYEHHLVWWQNTGNLVPEDFLIHHKNHQKRDNRFENLELQSRADHTREHTRERNPAVHKLYTCSECGDSFSLLERRAKDRLKRSKSKTLKCSKTCSMKAQIRTGIGGGIHSNGAR